MTYLNIIAKIDDKKYTIWRNFVNSIAPRNILYTAETFQRHFS